MTEKTARPAPVQSAGHKARLDLLFKTIDTQQYNLIVAHGKAASSPMKIEVVDGPDFNPRRSKRATTRMQWIGANGVPVAPPFRTINVEYLAGSINMIVPREDLGLYHMPTDVAPGEVYALRRFLATCHRASQRRIVRRNPACPLDLGFRSEKRNEAQWDFLLQIEEEDTGLLKAIGYYPDDCFEEELWQNILSQFGYEVNLTEKDVLVEPRSNGGFLQ